MAGKEPPKDPKALPGTGAAVEVPQKGSRVKKIVIILFILLIILAAGGGGAYWWFFLRAPGGTAEDAPVTTEEKSGTGSAGAPAKGENAPRLERQTDLPRSTGKVLPLPPFVVNLSDPTGKRYLKLGMEVEVNADVSQAIKTQGPKIRDAVIMLLAGKSFADVSSSEGKVLLKAEVAARLNQILGAPYVVRVYFTEFVVE